jgi:alpha-L-fucosidase
LRWRPAEADTPLRKAHWFWHPNDESSLKSLPELLTLYEQTVGRGGQLMLGLAPDRRGLLPDTDVRRLEEFGHAVAQRYGTNLAHKGRGTGEAGLEPAVDGDPDTFWSAPPASHHAVLQLDLAKPVTFDHLQLMERLNNGQHVQSFRVEVWDANHWQTVVEGHTIGHKRIEGFSPRTASRVRLNILSSTDAAEIRQFALFMVGDK